MASEVDTTVPAEGRLLYAEDIRDNMVIIANEITALQDAITGGADFPEAPSDGQIYGRDGTGASWQPVLPLTGGMLTGDATLGSQGTPLNIKATNLMSLMEFDNPYGFMQVGLQYNYFVIGNTANPMLQVSLDGNNAFFAVGNLTAQYQLTCQNVQVNGPATSQFQAPATFHDTVTVPEPVNSTDAATKDYVDSHAGGGGFDGGTVGGNIIIKSDSSPSLTLWDTTSGVATLMCAKPDGGIHWGASDGNGVPQNELMALGHAGGLTIYTNGLALGSNAVTDPTDLSQHIGLYSTAYGFSITNNQLNIVAAGATAFVQNGAKVAAFDGSGLTDYSHGIIYDVATQAFSQSHNMAFGWDGSNVFSFVDGTNIGQLANHNYVDTKLANYMPLSGVTNGSDASPGQIGEFAFNNATATTGIGNNVDVDLASIDLTAGDWDVSGAVYFQASTSAGTDDLRGWINTAATTQPSGDIGGLAIVSTTSGGLVNMLAVPPLRVNVTSDTTVYLGCNANYGGGNMQAKGLIRARRMR